MKKKKKTCTTGIGQNDTSGIVSAHFCHHCQTHLPCPFEALIEPT